MLHNIFTPAHFRLKCDRGPCLLQRLVHLEWGGSFQLPGVIERGLQGNTGNQCMAGARQVPRLTSSLGSGSENLTRLGRAGALGKAVRKFGL